MRKVFFLILSCAMIVLLTSSQVLPKAMIPAIGMDSVDMNPIVRYLLEATGLSRSYETVFVPVPILEEDYSMAGETIDEKLDSSMDREEAEQWLDSTVELSFFVSEARKYKTVRIMQKAEGSYEILKTNGMILICSKNPAEEDAMIVSKDINIKNDR